MNNKRRFQEKIYGENPNCHNCLIYGECNPNYVKDHWCDSWIYDNTYDYVTISVNESAFKLMGVP